MKRPLVWVGIAYIAGEIGAFYGFTPGVSLVFSLFMIGLIILTGRYSHLFEVNGMIFILPVFFMSGFAGLCRAQSMPAADSLFDETVAVTFAGKITDYEEKENSVVFVLKEAEVCLEGTEKVAETMSIMLYMEPEASDVYSVGDVVEGSGTMEKFENATNPGQFDAKAYYHSRGIDYKIWPENVKRISQTISYKHLLMQLRKKWLAVYQICLPQEEAGIMRAMILGDKSLLDVDIKSLYQQMGIIHILAISGLHVSIIGMGLFRLIKYTGAGIKVSACMSAFLVLSYCVISGAGPSTQRAVIMFLVRMGAEYFDRSYDRLSALALSALIIFIRHPLLVFQAGVQFSFVAVLSVGVLWPALEPLLKIKNRKISWLISQLGPSSAVTIGTVPLMAYYYGSVPLTGTLLNLIVLPLAGCIVPVGMTMGIVGLCCMPAASFLGGSLRSLLWLINHLCLMLASIPGNNLRTGSPPFMLLVLYYLAVLLTLLILNISEYRCRKAALLLGVCLMILIPFRRWEAMVVFLDVGQGDCIFIRDSKGTTWLIDGGSSDVKNVGKYRMLPLLDYYGEEKIDYVCVTHGDEDHVSGIRELIDASRAECLVLTSASMEDDTCMALAESAGQKMIKTIYINAGDQWNSRGWQMTCIAPDEGMSLNNKNDQSMILRLETGAMNFLFTGDISSDAEKRLDSELLMDIDVLKVAHHGSGSSSSEAFLETAGAGIAVISCGKNNRYGHPASDTMARLEAAGRQVYLTMDEGAIIMKYRNGRFVLDTDNDSCHD